MKGILITPGNQKTLMGRYNLGDIVTQEDINEVLPAGYILVADFGDDGCETGIPEVLTQETFDAKFTKGAAIKTGSEWFEAIPEVES